MKTNQCLIILLLGWIAVPTGAAVELGRLRGRNVAVSCFPLSAKAESAQRSLQARLEEILVDNGVHILDEAKAVEMRQGYHLLSDPTAVVTAELLLELRQKYRVDEVLNLYFDCDVNSGLADYYTATAQTEVRLIGSEARVEAHASRPMGVVGNPGSDAVTVGAARINALERAMDEVVGALGLAIAVPAEPRLVRLGLEPAMAPQGLDFRPLAKEVSLASVATAILEQQTWQKEEVTLTAASPDGNYAAVATYWWSQRQGSRRIYGSRLHLLDIRADRRVAIYDFSPLAIPERHEKKSKKILAAAFLSGWRFLVVVNANELVLFDVERGRELVRSSCSGDGAAQLTSAVLGRDYYLRVQLGLEAKTFRLVVVK